MGETKQAYQENHTLFHSIRKIGTAVKRKPAIGQKKTAANLSDNTAKRLKIQEKIKRCKISKKDKKCRRFIGELFVISPKDRQNVWAAFGKLLKKEEGKRYDFAKIRGLFKRMTKKSKQF